MIDFETNKIYHMDCLEGMQVIPSKSVDMILCDLPYGTSACKWDEVIPFAELWAQYERIIKDNGAIVLFGGEPFSSRLRLSNLGLYKYEWKWEKPSGANFLNFKYQPAKVHEDIMVFGKMATSYSRKGNLSYYPQMEKGAPYTTKEGGQREAGHSATFRSQIKQTASENKGTRYPRSILKFKLDKEKFHPTQKPVALCEYLIKTYTNPGELVLDNCIGSGTTAVAALRTGRRFIGFELDKNYYNIAVQRVRDTEQALIASDDWML